MALALVVMPAAGDNPVVAGMTDEPERLRGPAPLTEELEARIAAEEPVLLAAARLIVFNDADAWDLAHTTIEIALRERSSLRNPDSLRAWLLTIQSRQAFRLTRRLRRCFSLDDAEISEPSYEFSDDEVCLREALRTLPPRTRNAIILHHITGMTVQDMAAALGVSQNTVKSQLKTGLARLRDTLHDDQIEAGRNG